MKNTSHIGSGGHRPAALEPGSSRLSSWFTSIGPFRPRWNRWPLLIPCPGTTTLRLSSSPNARSKIGITPSRRAASRGSNPKRGRIGANPGDSPPQQQQWILERVRSFPGVPVKLLYRQWKQADATLPALSAVYRWLEQNDLDAQGRRYLLRQNIPGPTKAFEAPGVNDLWIVDFSPGPFPGSAPQDGGHSPVRDHR